MGLESEPGQCSLRPRRNPSPSTLLASFDLRGWLPLRADVCPALAPVAAVPRLLVRPPRFIPHSPEPPPPRSLAFA